MLKSPPDARPGRIQTAAQKKMEGMRSHLGAARQEREKLKAEISNLASVVADGRQSTALLAELEKRERRLDKISEELLASTDNGLEMKLQKIEEFAMKRLRDIQGLLGGDVLRAKSELAKRRSGSAGVPDSTARTAEFSLSFAA